jgi:cell division protein FtsB
MVMPASKEWIAGVCAEVIRERDELREYGLQAASELGTLSVRNDELQARVKTLEARLDQILILANLE